MSVGLDVRRYIPARSEAARLGRLLQYYRVDLVVDVGANTGQFAEYLRLVGYRGKIVSFEPLSVAYTQLERLSKRDSMMVCAPRMALGEYDGEVIINIAANHDSSSILQVLESHSQQASCVGCETVPIRKLDTILDEYLAGSVRPFLKIDVQGYEQKVLSGAIQSLQKFVGIQLELSLTPVYEGEHGFKEMLKYVEQCGFVLHDLYPCYSDDVTGRTYQVDALFFKC